MARTFRLHVRHAFASTRTPKSEAKLLGPELEISGLAWAVRTFRYFLEGASAPIVVITDHSPLGAIINAKPDKQYTPIISEKRAMIGSIAQRMKFLYKQGSTHTNVDSLSRLDAAPLATDVRHTKNEICKPVQSDALNQS